MVDAEVVDADVVTVVVAVAVVVPLDVPAAVAAEVLVPPVVVDEADVVAQVPPAAAPMVWWVCRFQVIRSATATAREPVRMAEQKKKIQVAGWCQAGMVWTE